MRHTSAENNAAVAVAAAEVALKAETDVQAAAVETAIATGAIR